MSAIRFRTTSKGDLLHNSYIFRNPETLGTEMNNVVCSRLGTMLHLEIQKGKEAMKTSNFQKYLGGTAACMKRQMMATKGCGKLTSNDTYFDDIQFGGVKNADYAMAEGAYYCGKMKMIHKGFFLATLEKLMKDCPGGSYLVMKSTSIVHGGIPIMSIGYRYNYSKVIGFIATEGGGSTQPGDSYLSQLPGIYSNVSVRPVFHPRFLCRSFNACNAIDSQNRMHQSDIALDKYWVT